MGLKTVVLTKQHCRALKREAWRGLENSIGERHLCDGGTEGEKEEKDLLACADVLGALKWGCLPGSSKEDSKHEIAFTPAAVAWARRVRTEVQEHAAHLDGTSEEGSYDYRAKEAFLLHTLGYVLKNIDTEEEADG